MELRDKDGQPFTNAHLGESFSHVYMGKDHPEAAAALAQIVVAFDRDGDEELVVLRPIVVAPDGAEVDVCPYYEAAAQPKEVLLVLTGPPEVVEQLAAAPEGYGSEASPDTGASPLAKNAAWPTLCLRISTCSAPRFQERDKLLHLYIKQGEGGKGRPCS